MPAEEIDFVFPEEGSDRQGIAGALFHSCNQRFFSGITRALSIYIGCRTDQKISYLQQLNLMRPHRLDPLNDRP